MAEYVLSSGGPVKTADVAREVGDRVGASARLVRNELTRSHRLTMVERRWDLKSRQDGRRRSTDGALQAILRECGKPMRIAHLAGELAVVRRRSREDLQRVVTTLCGSRDSFFVTGDGLVGLREWLLDVAPGETDETVRQQNFFQADVDLDAALDHLDLDSARAEEDAVQALYTLVHSAQEPVAARLLLYSLWVAKAGKVDVNAAFLASLSDPRVVVLPGPAFATQTYADQLAEVIRDLSEQQDDQITGADQMDVGELLATDEAAEFSLASDDLSEIQRIIQEAGEALTLASLVSDVFELFPGDVQYAAALRAMQLALRGDDRFVELTENRWHLRVLLPPTLYRVPVTLQLSPIQVATLTGELVDAQLTDAGLEGGIEWEVHAPDLEDIGEDNEVMDLPEGIQLAKKQRFVTSYRHFVSGTIKVRKIDRGVFPKDPPIRPIKMVDDNTGEVFELWLNNETGLLCGLDEWYKGRLQPTGHVFHIERDEAKEVWRASVEPEPDPMHLIPQPHLDELLVLRVKVEHVQDVSVLEIMRQLMAHHPGGVSFRRLYTECNIVRRVAKRVIASNLSSYPMFALNDDQTLWLYDERKSNRPRAAEKKAFIIE
ncbi:MAG: hypothetical protein HZB16_19370 [Armatimonadetes bacterium]|nr:hypothetical protein [Armatimonadota bacterium]